MNKHCDKISNRFQPFLSDVQKSIVGIEIERVSVSIPD